jgi:signal transduction histidine kinase
MEQQQQALARLVQSAHLASVGLLAGGVAHDINNPLCIISNHLQLLRLRKSETPIEVEEALGSIETSVRRIAGSIEALLEYARVQPGERQPTDLNEAMRRILVLLQYHPLCRRLSVVTDLETALPMVDLDRPAWEQVMLELVTNAREAMADGGRVRIATRRVLPEGEPSASPWIEVTVEDDGPGIPPEEVARVFDPFFTTRTTKRGMGIGLKICRDIVHEHGGRMRVESESQAGTRVVILLRASGPIREHGDTVCLRHDQ